MKRFQQPQTVTGLAPGYKDAIVAVEYGTRRNQGSAVTTRAGVGSISVSSSGLYRTGYDGGSNVAADVFTGAPTSGFTIVCVYDLATSSGSYVPIVGGDQPSNRQFQLLHHRALLSLSGLTLRKQTIVLPLALLDVLVW